MMFIRFILNYLTSNFCYSYTQTYTKQDVYFYFKIQQGTKFYYYFLRIVWAKMKYWHFIIDLTWSIIFLKFIKSNFSFLFFSLFLKEKFIGLLFEGKHINRFHKEYKTSGFYLFSSFVDEKIINKSLRNLSQQLKWRIKLYL